MKNLIFTLFLFFALTASATFSGSEVPVTLSKACLQPENASARNIQILNLVQPVESFGNAIEIVFALDTADCLDGRVMPAAGDLMSARLSRVDDPKNFRVALMTKLSQYRYAIQINLPKNYFYKLGHERHKFNVVVEFKEKSFPYCLIANKGTFSLEKSSCSR
jgi:hypothetical protein